ncbi:paraneoplastic antigen Ma6F [Eptesicus fuscus]|uniref:paraneoplastic antigen Ma6F n=1 Tax=Eptesicus fuscus TaxID=29078 RepID=UPI002403D41A|nr:paraneoplastic antigen Ma6F [Eptesicus fuscus]
MALTMLRDWCGWMGVNSQRAVLVLGIPDDCEEEDFQEALQDALWPLGRDFYGNEQPGHKEPFESWLDHANEMLYLWRHISERERRRRLVESLHGPAQNFMYGFLNENPAISAQDCLTALAHVFKNKDTLAVLRLKFVNCAQQPQESLFAYVIRLEDMLHAAMEKEAIHPGLANEVRSEQVLMRGRPNEKLQNKLKRMHLEGKPPGFLEMLRLVRESEACEATPTMRQQFQVEEPVWVDITELAAARATLAREGAAQAAPAHEDVGQVAPAHEDRAQTATSHEDAAQTATTNEDAVQASPAHENVGQAAPANEDAAQDALANEDVGQASTAEEDAAQAALSKEDGAEATLAKEVAIEAGPATADPDEAAPETSDATGADPAPEDTTKASPAVQADENVLAPAGLGQAGPFPAHMGIAFEVGSGGPGYEPEGLLQEEEEEAKEPHEEGLILLPEESGSEDGSGEMSPPEPSFE